MSIRIVTDSASDLPKAVAAAEGIDILPILVYVDGQEYLDSVTIEPDDFYNRMRAGSEVKTAQIPLAFFIETFERYAQSEDHYIYFAFSSQLSGTYQTAVMAYDTVRETYPDFQMDILDTRCVSLGLGVLVVEAARMARQGASAEDIVSYVRTAGGHMAHLFSVDDLEYLLRGGRVSRSQAFLGNILNIKPILHVKDGALIPFEKVKGRKKRLGKMFEYIEAHGSDLGNQLIGIAHTLNEEEANAVRSHFETTYGTKDFIVSSLGCTVGAHCGPGLITLFFKSEAPINYEP